MLQLMTTAQVFGQLDQMHPRRRVSAASLEGKVEQTKPPRDLPTFLPAVSLSDKPCHCCRASAHDGCRLRSCTDLPRKGYRIRAKSLSKTGTTHKHKPHALTSSSRKQNRGKSICKKGTWSSPLFSVPSFPSCFSCRVVRNQLPAARQVPEAHALHRHFSFPDIVFQLES